MKRLVAVALGAAFFAGVAVAGLGRDTQRPLVLRGAASQSPLLGIAYEPRRSWLERLDRKTLRPTRGRKLDLAEFTGGWDYSPDRRLLAVGNHSTTASTYAPARIRLLDARRLRKVRDLQLGLTGEVRYTYWASPDRLIALVESRDDPGNEGDPPVVTDHVAVLDPVSGTVRANAKLDGRVAALAITDDALALVLEGSSYGPVRLVVARADGRLASVLLEQIEAGLYTMPNEIPREEGVGIAVDRQAGRAYVIAAGDPVAQVDLATLAVAYHLPSQPVSLLGRLHNWLEPSAKAKGPLEGSWRYAAWLGDGRLAVYGRDNSTYPTGDGLAVRERPSGLLVVDTRSWTARTLDPSASSLVVANGLLLSWGAAWDGGTQRWTGAGLNAYDESGTRRFHLFRMINTVQVVGRRAFVWRGALYNRYSVVDLSSGRELRTIHGRDALLALTGAAPQFYG